MKKTIILATIIISTLIIFYINLESNNISDKNLEMIYSDKYGKYINTYKHKNLLKYNIKKTSNLSLNDGKNIILLYQQFDCPSCILASYNILNQFSQKNTVKRFIISNNNFKNEKILYDYKKNINDSFIEDPNLTYKNKLKNIKTPVILLIDKNIIVDLVFPTRDLPTGEIEIIKKFLQ